MANKNEKKPVSPDKGKEPDVYKRSMEIPPDKPPKKKT